MKKINSKMISVMVSAMLLMTTFLVPGLFNFDAISASEELTVEIGFGGDNNVVSTVKPTDVWNDFVADDSQEIVGSITSIDGRATINILEISLRGNGDSEIIVELVGSSEYNVENIVLNYRQSGGEGGGNVTNLGNVYTYIGNNLNFLEIGFDLVPIVVPYVLTYVTNQETITINPVEFEENDAIVAPTPTVDGLTFLGWYDDAELTVMFNQFGSMPANDVTVYGKWEQIVIVEPQPVTYTLTYVTNQETVNIDPVEFEENDSIVAPTPTVDGSTFLGWYDDAELTVMFNQFDSMPANDVIVYALWQEIVDEEEVIIDVVDEETDIEVDVIVDDGEVLGDSDEFVEEEVVVVQEDEEVLDDSDETEETILIPVMDDEARTLQLGLFFLILGLLTVVATKKEKVLA